MSLYSIAEDIMCVLPNGLPFRSLSILENVNQQAQ